MKVTKISIVLSIVLMITFSVVYAMQSNPTQGSTTIVDLGVHGYIFGPVLGGPFEVQTGSSSGTPVKVKLLHRDGVGYILKEVTTNNGFYNTGGLSYSPADYPLVTVIIGSNTKTVPYEGITRVDFVFDKQN